MPGNISVLFIMELIGTAAFSCSGAMVAIKKNLDLLGIVVLGVITAVGGGMIRDVLLGTHHGNILQNCHTGGCAHTGRPVAGNSACGPTAMFCTISFAMPAHFCKFAARQEIRHTHACSKH